MAMMMLPAPFAVSPAPRSAVTTAAAVGADGVGSCSRLQVYRNVLRNDPDFEVKLLMNACLL